MILCLGTTPALQRTMIFQHLAINGVNRASQSIESPAGKSVNVAKVLAALGDAPLATGFLGGHHGQLLRQYLDTATIPHDFVTVAPQTRLCITLIDRSNQTHTELIEESLPLDPPDFLALLDKLNTLLPRAEILTLSGTLPPNAPADFYARCVSLANQASVPVILDAHGPPLLAALPARPTIVKPNRSELARTLNLTLDSDSALRDASRRLTDLGAHTVIITLGPDGALAFHSRRFYRITPPHIHAVNTIGSGDAFTAGLASALAKSQPFPDALRLAAACGAANALTDLCGHVNPPDVSRLLPQISIDTPTTLNSDPSSASNPS